MTLTKRAVWVIERNLAGDVSLAGVAEACGVSRHHLAHAFGDSLGVGVMAYVRARRLSEAAGALAAGARNILEVGLEAGYGSHEAFTRAFRAQFGKTPEAVRRARSTEGLALATAAQIVAESPAPEHPPALVERDTMRLVGLGGRTSFAAPEAIPALWRRFGPVFDALPRRASPIPMGVLADLDEEGTFDYFCAAEVAGFDAGFDDLTQLTLAPQTYAVFRHTAHVVMLRHTYSGIWDRWLDERGWRPVEAPILERHDPAFDPQTGLGGLEIWAPVAA
jgi:AraC family transcriptional regulator